MATCLVIEDEGDTARYICNGLKEPGFTVIWCRDGVDGLHLAAGERWADVAVQEGPWHRRKRAYRRFRSSWCNSGDLLAAVAGRFPGEEPSEKFGLDNMRLPQQLPVNLPAKVVEQRPDVGAAEAQLYSASARIGVAVANRLPNITLSANGGYAANVLSQLFGPGNSYLSLAASLTQPIFEGVTPLHLERAARAAYDEALAQY